MSEALPTALLCRHRNTVGQTLRSPLLRSRWLRVSRLAECFPALVLDLAFVIKAWQSAGKH
jgi:hypothetical protein